MASPRGPLSSVEQVRDELRRLGYFEHGLDRFVLAGAGASPRPGLRRRPPASASSAGSCSAPPSPWPRPSWTRACAASPATSSSSLWTSPRWHWSPAVAAFVGGLPPAGGRRRRPSARAPTVSRNIGLALGVSAAATWPSGGARTRGERRSSCRWRPPFSASRSARPSAASGRWPPPSPCSPRAGWATAPRGQPLAPPDGAAADRGRAVAGWRVAGAAYLSGSSRGAAPDFAVVPPGSASACSASTASIGGWPSTCRPRGDAAAGQALLARGAHARLRPEPEQVPAIVWTTIATGRGPEAHGIRVARARAAGAACTRPCRSWRPGRVRAGAPPPTSCGSRGAAADARCCEGEDVLERRVREGPARGRGELVGDLAGRSGQRLRGDRARVLQGRARRGVRSRDCTARGVRSPASAGRAGARTARARLDAFTLAAARALRGARPARRRSRLPARPRHRHHAAPRRGRRGRPGRPRRAARRGARLLPIRGPAARRGGGGDGSG